MLLSGIDDVLFFLVAVTGSSRPSSSESNNEKSLSSLSGRLTVSNLAKAFYAIHGEKRASQQGEVSGKRGSGKRRGNEQQQEADLGDVGRGVEGVVSVEEGRHVMIGD